MKKLGIALLVLLAGVGIFLALPSQYYLRQALIHLTPKIDQYPIFSNRVVKADEPIAWERAAAYNKLTLPNHYRPYFEEMGTVAFVLIHKGKLLHEEYWQGYSDNSLSNSFSMAKSIVSLAIGCAIDDGFIRSVNQPVSDFYPHLTGFNGKTLTIRHLLTMSGGFDFQESYTSPFSPTTKLYYGNDLSSIALGMQVIEEPGIYFNYQSGVTQLLALILEKAVGEPLSEYVSRKLWTPMHAEEDALWSLDRNDGIEKAYCCFNSNATDFARFGQLLLNRGEWEGKQLISAHYLREATTPDPSLIVEGMDVPNREYGYQFWKLRFRGMEVDYLRGILGQYVFAIPERELVVVRLGHKRSETRSQQHYPDDIDVWLAAALDMLEGTHTIELTFN